MNIAADGFRLETGSRLHFGLFSFGAITSDQPNATRFENDQQPEYSFGGIGLMIDQPQTVIEFRPSEKLEISGDRFGRSETFVERWYESSLSLVAQHGDGRNFSELPVSISVIHQPPEHSGLGAGTQFALSLAYGLFRFFGQTEMDPVTLATSVGRGLRSAIGTHGFFRGGFLVDRGKFQPNSLGVLDGCFPLPENWRVILIRRKDAAITVYGEKEIKAFAELPPIPPTTTARLVEWAHQSIVPALIAADFASFSESIYQYGLLAGQCFESVQGGPFASRWAEETIRKLRSFGIHGVGQSSWGPTLFAFAKDTENAENICRMLQQECDLNEEDLMITSARNRGFNLIPIRT